MNFIDEAHIKVTAGRGGSGSASFRREKYIPRGGPDGGNGGNGGSVILMAENNLSTLSNFLTKKHFKAETGEDGRSRNQFGKNGEDTVLPVPLGTIVRQEGSDTILADLANQGDCLVIAQGGRGGKGNANFKSSVRQAPDFSEKGEPGEEKEVYLELKLIADIAIIGYPSVGKSTLISRISNAKPKIADYPFTTLVPNLGVVRVDDVDFVVADIPGLIEGAHKGKGLGIQFLKHIERSRFLVHVLDLTREDLKGDYKKINRELAAYSKVLSKCEQLIVLNKKDSATEEVTKEMAKHFRTKKPVFISAVTGEGLNDLLYRLKEMILREREKRAEAMIEPEENDKIKKPHLFRPHLDLPESQRFTIEKEGDGFRVKGKRIEQIAIMTDYTKWGGIRRLQDVLKKIGAQKELVRMGAKEGDSIYIGENKVEFIVM